jgi:serine protease DegS
MKQLHASLVYLIQAIILGLAMAFLATQFWPQSAADKQTGKIQIRQVAAPAAKQQSTGSYADAVDAAAPAVVNINTSKIITIAPHPFFEDPVFRQFFGRNLNELIKPKKQLQSSLGSGVIMSSTGLVLTNHHVISGADAIQVSLRDGRTTEAKVIGSDPETDVAVLKINLDDLPVITLGHSETMRVGDIVLAIGNPFGVGQTVTMGIVSATGRNKLGINTFENFIQTDAAINPGNSGGALVDTQGNLVGINTAIFSKSGGSQGIGFAIPAKLAQKILQEIVEFGRPRRGWLGIEGDPVTPALAKDLGLDAAIGIVVVGVLRNGPAHLAGIEPGDVILQINGVVINDSHTALVTISDQKPGAKFDILLHRNGKEIKISVTAAERPPRRPEK